MVEVKEMTAAVKQEEDKERTKFALKKGMSD
jgi:hypothetical protein